MNGLFACRTVDSVVVRKLGKWQPIGPVVLSVVDEDSKVLFDFLVDSFSLSVGLWVKGRGRIQGDVEESVEFLHEFRDELRASVGDNDLGHSVFRVYVIS